MPKRFIKKFIPEHKTICEHKHLRVLGPLLEDPNILHLNRRSVSGAFAVGLFMAFVPIPFQMLLAAVAAIYVKVNLPISVALVWISNPITIPPLFYFSYQVGAWVLGIPERGFNFELSFEWLAKSLGMIWEPFLLGCALVGAICALSGSLLVRLLWRWKVVQSWNERKQRRQKAKLESK